MRRDQRVDERALATGHPSRDLPLTLDDDPFGKLFTRTLMGGRDTSITSL
jgi:hypothetical protein